VCTRDKTILLFRNKWETVDYLVVLNIKIINVSNVVWLHTSLLCLPLDNICRSRYDTLEKVCSCIYTSISEKVFWLQFFIGSVSADNCFVLDIRVLGVTNPRNFSWNIGSTLGDLLLLVIQYIKIKFVWHYYHHVIIIVYIQLYQKDQIKIMSVLK